MRKGANPGFHEAIGDTIALSVANPRHLVKIGLLDAFNDTKENSINALYAEALGRVAFLPFGLLIDKWRWDVFSGKVSENEWNKHWWDLREKYQKVSSPVERDETDFDPGAKFHVPASSKYISYFISHLLEFQLFRSMCIEAGEYHPVNSDKPLHECDFYESEEAGERLAKGLRLGASKHWSEALKLMTNESQISASALLEYFNPLYEFLKEDNKEHESLQAINEENENKMRETLNRFNEEATIKNHNLQIAEWNRITDLNNQTLATIYEQAVRDNAQFRKEQYNIHFREVQPESFSDQQIRRQVRFAKNLDVNILDDTKLDELTKVKSEMEKIYNRAQFCSYYNQNCSKDHELTLDPGKL